MRETFGAVPSRASTPYVYLDGTYVKRNWAGACEGVGVAIGIQRLGLFVRSSAVRRPAI